MMHLEFILTGLLVGMLIGLTGVGGGSLMTPILVLLLGVHPSIAVGTDLTYASVTKALGTIQHIRQGHVRISTGLSFAIGSIPASIVGVSLLSRLQKVSGVNIDTFISHALAGVLFFVVVMLIVEPVIRRRLWPSDQSAVFQTHLFAVRKHRTPMLIAIGVLVGLLVGVTSVGGGSLVMFAMLLLFPKWPMRQRVGTDVFHGCLLSAAAAAAHWRLGSVDLPIAAQLLMGSLPGVLIGGRLVKVVPEAVLRPLVAGALALSAWRLV